jgi:2-methylisocitrate lyase-like PEP mutase family enzyme
VINLILGGKTPPIASRKLHALGFKVVLYSTPALYAATHAMVSAMKALRETGELESIADRSVRFREFQGLLESSYLGRRGHHVLAPQRGVESPFSAEESTMQRLLRARLPEPGQA